MEAPIVNNGDDLVFTSVVASAEVKKEKRESDSQDALSAERTRTKELSEDAFKSEMELDPAKAPPPSKYYCNKCNYNTYHRSAFQEHLNRHKGIKPYKCELCPYTSVSKNYTKKHQDKHKVCACGFVSLKNRTEFKRHVKMCTKIEQRHSYMCPRCAREFVDDKGLASHLSRIKTCNICSEQCCALKLHKLQVHGEKTKIEHKKERFECAICGWSCSLPHKILLHLIHHPAQDVDESALDVEVLRRCGILPSLRD